MATVTIKNHPTEKVSIVNPPKHKLHWPVGKPVTLGEKAIFGIQNEEYSQNVYVDGELIGKIFSFMATPSVSDGRNFRRDLVTRRVWSAGKMSYNYYSPSRHGAILDLIRGLYTL